MGPRVGPPLRRGRCTPPPPTPPHPHRPRSPPAAEEEVWVPQTPARRQVEAEAARLRLEIVFRQVGRKRQSIREKSTLNQEHR